MKAYCSTRWSLGDRATYGPIQSERCFSFRCEPITTIGHSCRPDSGLFFETCTHLSEARRDNGNCRCTTFDLHLCNNAALTVGTQGFMGELACCSVVVLPHAVLGSLVEIFGVYLVLTWAVHHREVKACFRKKKFMKPTLILWLIELAIGICVYILLYVRT
jgi:hypothetical protein